MLSLLTFSFIQNLAKFWYAFGWNWHMQRFLSLMVYVFIKGRRVTEINHIFYLVVSWPTFNKNLHYCECIYDHSFESNSIFLESRYSIFAQLFFFFRFKYHSLEMTLNSARLLSIFSLNHN